MSKLIREPAGVRDRSLEPRHQPFDVVVDGVGKTQLMRREPPWPQALGVSFSEVTAVLSRVPRSSATRSAAGCRPQAMPALFGAQADLIHETATASATGKRLTHWPGSPA